MKYNKISAHSVMKTAELIAEMDKQSFCKVTAVLSSGDIILQRGALFTQEDYDRLLAKLRNCKSEEE